MVGSHSGLLGQTRKIVSVAVVALAVCFAFLASVTVAHAGEPGRTSTANAGVKFGYETKWDCLVVNTEYQRYYETDDCYYRDVPAWAGGGWAFKYW
jgi:hypothetical protein